MYVRDHYLVPYIDPSKTVLEIGPGGGALDPVHDECWNGIRG